MAVLDTAAELRPQAAQPMALMLAALAHDFGKVAATTGSQAASSTLTATRRRVCRRRRTSCAG